MPAKIRTVMCVGIGHSPVMGGTTLAHLDAEVARVRATYNPPDTAHVIPTAPGSIYLVELSWIGERDAN